MISDDVPVDFFLPPLVVLLFLPLLVTREEKKIHDRLEKKFQNLLAEKQMKNGIQPNPNKLVLNLTGVELTNEQYSALQFGLKHGIATRPRESDLIASAESVWEQLTRDVITLPKFIAFMALPISLSYGAPLFVGK